MSSRETQDQELTVIMNDTKGPQSSGKAETQMMNNENEANTESDFPSPAAQPLMPVVKKSQREVKNNKNTYSSANDDISVAKTKLNIECEENNHENSSSSEVNFNNQEETENVSCWEATFTPTPIKKCKVTELDLILLIFSALTYLADIGTDIWVAVKHYQNGDIAWMALTITFVAVPSLITIAAIASQGSWDGIKKNLLIALSGIIPGGLIIQIMQDIRKAHKAMKRKDDPSHLVDRVTLTLIFRLYEAYGEAAPQLILQLYIILKDTRTIDPIQWISVTISLVSLSWSMVSFYKTSYMDHRALKPPHLGVVLCLGWHLCTVWARVVAFAICAIYSIYLFIGILGLHFLVALIYLRCIYHVEGLKDFLFEGSINSLMSLISSFILLGLETTRRKCLFLHTLIYLENVCMLLLWLYSPKSYDAPQWLRYLASVSIFAVYLIGVFFQIVYYVDLHPKNFEKEKRKHIQICIPWKKWLEKTDWDI